MTGKVHISRRISYRLWRNKPKPPLMTVELTVDGIPSAVFYPRQKDFPISFGRDPSDRNSKTTVRICDRLQTIEANHFVIAIEDERLVIRRTAQDLNAVMYYTPEGAETPHQFMDEVFVDCAKFVLSSGNVSVRVQMLPEIGKYLRRTYNLKVETYASGGATCIITASQDNYISGRSCHPQPGVTVYPMNVNTGLIAQVRDRAIVTVGEQMKFTKDGVNFSTRESLEAGNSFFIMNAGKKLMSLSVQSVFDPVVIFGEAEENPKKTLIRNSITNAPEFVKRKEGNSKSPVFEVTLITRDERDSFVVEERHLPVRIGNKYDYNKEMTSQIVVNREAAEFSSYIEIFNDRPYFSVESSDGMIPTVLSGMKITAYAVQTRYDITGVRSTFRVGSTTVIIRILPEWVEKFSAGTDYICEVECLLAQDQNSYVYENVTFPRYREIIIHRSTTFGRDPMSDVLLLDGRETPTVSRAAFYAEADPHGLTLRTSRGDQAFRWKDPFTGQYVVSSDVPLSVGLTIQYKDAYTLRITDVFRLQ